MAKALIRLVRFFLTGAAIGVAAGLLSPPRSRRTGGSGDSRLPVPESAGAGLEPEPSMGTRATAQEAPAATVEPNEPRVTQAKPRRKTAASSKPPAKKATSARVTDKKPRQEK